MKDSPLSRYDWTGNLISNDETPTVDFKDDDVERVLQYGDTGDGWDGEVAGVLLLKDGRFVSWESDWGPTGSGFCCDAYGGKADINFSSTLEKALEYLSERSRELLRPVAEVG